MGTALFRPPPVAVSIAGARSSQLSQNELRLFEMPRYRGSYLKTRSLGPGACSIAFARSSVTLSTSMSP